MDRLQKNTAQKINELHGEIENHLRQGLSKAIQVGSLLSETKQRLPHGKFTGWISDHVSFSPRTARNYMKLFDNKNKLQDADSINGAYKLLNGKTETVSDFKSGNFTDLPNKHIDSDYEFAKKVLTYLNNAGLKTLKPNKDEIIRLYNFKPLDRYMMRGTDLLEIKLNKEYPEYVNPSVIRFNEDNCYKIHCRRGGFKWQNDLFFIRLFTEHFNFYQLKDGGIMKNGDLTKAFQFEWGVQVYPDTEKNPFAPDSNAFHAREKIFN
jgi:hypothetical protein